MRTFQYLFTIFCLLFAITTSQAVNPVSGKEKDDKEEVKDAFMTANEFAHLKVRDYKALTGRDKISLKERIGFGLMKRSVRKQIRKGNLTGQEEVNAAVAAAFQMNWGAFVVGLLFSVIGVLLVLLLFEDPDAWKSALIGFLVGILLGVTLIL